MTAIPTLETERLILRPMRVEDWPSYFTFCRSDRSKGMGGPFTEEQAWGMFCHDAGQWTLFGIGALMIEDRKTGKALGQICLSSGKGPLFPEDELGWFLYEEVEGKGIAFEAAVAMRDWAFGTAGLETLVSYIDADNPRSRALAERLGAVLDPDAEGPDPADLVYRYPIPNS